MSIMDRAKRTVCNLRGHDWYHTGTTWSHGMKETRRSFRCLRCNDRKATLNDVDLPADEATEVLKDMDAGARAVMYLLDNVEPTYSAETIDGKTVVKHNGEVIK